ncbi:hypothetical protein CPAV1605_525 [seawater metagenome]|uniref:Ubiquitin-like protease family profile domain-containing protein n=1 Tax=seawater metagenome TaxID=1561972 RepID=A0A5E8CM39_9ZZZZ
MSLKEKNNDLNQKCAPSKNYKDGSCFTYESLKKIANAYNLKASNNKINTDTVNKKDLVHDLENKLKTNCDNQVCWLRQDFIKKIESDEISKNTFRPEGPQKKYDWLSTTHINEVIDQYHNVHKNFRFLGAVPIDFDDLPVLGLCDLNLENLESEGINKIGIVFNLDEHYKDGSHWVALFSDLENYQTYFFDSYGKKPDRRIRRFISRIVKHMYKKKYNKKLSVKEVLEYLKKDKKKLINNSIIKNLQGFDIDYNKIRHQYKNSECGVYSINFILELLDGKTFHHIVNNKTYDDEMNTNRKIYFR